MHFSPPSAEQTEQHTLNHPPHMLLFCIDYCFPNDISPVASGMDVFPRPMISRRKVPPLHGERLINCRTCK
jgi:hypothetical protein